MAVIGKVLAHRADCCGVPNGADDNAPDSGQHCVDAGRTVTWPLLSPASGEIPFTGRPHWLTSHYLTSWERGAGVTVRRLILLVGAVLLVAGVVGLLLPVSVTQEGGGSIGCGNAVASNLQEAKDKTPRTSRSSVSLSRTAITWPNVIRSWRAGARGRSR